MGNPFIDVAAAEQLRCLYDAIAPIFGTTGASCRKRFNSLVFEVRRPFAPVHLINVCPIASVAEWDARLGGSVMALSVWVRREGAPNQRVSPGAVDTSAVQARGCL